MKLVIVAFLFLLSGYSSRAQINFGEDIEKGYRDFVQKTRSGYKSKELSDFASLGGSKRFFSDDWSEGVVTTGYGVTIGKNYKFNYDFLDNELYALYQDTVVAVNHDFISSFYLIKNDGVHFFFKIPTIDNAGFLESLGYDSTKKNGVQVLKIRKTTLVKGDKNSYLANFSGDYADNIKVKTEYYLYSPDGNATKIKMDKKNLMAALKDNKKADSFFSTVKEINEQNVNVLLALINS